MGSVHGKSNRVALGWVVRRLGIIFVSLLMSTGMGLAQVHEEWVARYNGPENGVDEARAIAIDKGGNVYVTGKSYGSGSSWDFATLKYDENGNILWEARYNGPGNFDDGPVALELDQKGSVYVTGYSYISTNFHDTDFITIKYDSGGNPVWEAQYNGPGNFWDEPRAISVDKKGNVYVTGHSRGMGTVYDYTTIKYDTDGNQIWAVHYNGSGNHDDRPTGMAVDQRGHVYVVGYSLESGTDYDYTTIKYDLYGNQLWVAHYNGTANGRDIPVAIVTDEEDDVYVTGYSEGFGTAQDYTTIKYDGEGNQLWTARYNGPVNGTDYPVDVFVDKGGHVYVTGFSAAGTTRDYATVTYDADGNQLWVARYNGTGNNNDDAEAIAVVQNGSIYVSGTSAGSGTSEDYTTIKYDAKGNLLWEVRYNGSGNSHDSVGSLVVGKKGEVYVTGSSIGYGTSYDYATIKYRQLKLVESGKE